MFTILQLIKIYRATSMEVTLRWKTKRRRLYDFQNMGPKMKCLWTPSKDPFWTWTEHFETAWKRSIPHAHP